MLPQDKLYIAHLRFIQMGIGKFLDINDKSLQTYVRNMAKDLSKPNHFLSLLEVYPPVMDNATVLKGIKNQILRKYYETDNYLSFLNYLLVSVEKTYGNANNILKNISPYFKNYPELKDLDAKFSTKPWRTSLFREEIIKILNDTINTAVNSITELSYKTCLETWLCQDVHDVAHMISSLSPFPKESDLFINKLTTIHSTDTLSSQCRIIPHDLAIEFLHSELERINPEMENKDTPTAKFQTYKECLQWWKSNYMSSLDLHDSMVKQLGEFEESGSVLLELSDSFSRNRIVSILKSELDRLTEDKPSSSNIMENYASCLQHWINNYEKFNSVESLRNNHRTMISQLKDFEECSSSVREKLDYCEHVHDIVNTLKAELGRITMSTSRHEVLDILFHLACSPELLPEKITKIREYVSKCPTPEMLLEVEQSVLKNSKLPEVTKHVFREIRSRLGYKQDTIFEANIDRDTLAKFIIAQDGGPYSSWTIVDSGGERVTMDGWELTNYVLGLSGTFRLSVDPSLPCPDKSLVLQDVEMFRQKSLVVNFYDGKELNQVWTLK